MGDIWKGLQRMEPVETASGRIEIAYEVGTKTGPRAARFLPAWALYLLPLPEGAHALVVISRGLTLSVFLPTRLRCTFAHEEPPETLTTQDLATAVREHLSAGGRLDDVFSRYRALVSGVSVL